MWASGRRSFGSAEVADRCQPLVTGTKEHDDGYSGPRACNLAGRASDQLQRRRRWRNNFWQLTIDGLAYGAIYALVAVGYTLVYGVLRLINFAHSEIFMLGMFGQYAVLMLLGLHPERERVHRGHVADDRLPRHRDARRHGRLRRRRGRPGAAGLPAAAQTQRAVAGLPDHRHRRVVRDPGIRALRAAAADRRRTRRGATPSSRSGWSRPRSSSPSSARRSPTSR